MTKRIDRKRKSRRLGRGLAVVLALAFVVSVLPLRGDTAAVIEALRSVQLETGKAVAVHDVWLNLGMAKLHMREGILVPTSQAGGTRASEVVFVGTARFLLEAPDKIEAGQLELFTGSENLSEATTAAVLAIGSNAAVAVLLKRPLATAVDPAILTQAEALFRSWRQSPERRALGIEESQILDLLGHAPEQGFFAARLETEEAGTLLYTVEPEAYEQVTLGQFVAVDATRKERKKLVRALGREQRRGRLLNVTLEDLGDWDTWVSTSLRDSQGAVTPGRPSFEVEHTELDVQLMGRELDLEVSARLVLRATHGLSRFVRFQMANDLVVSQVRDSRGERLFFHQEGPRTWVELPAMVPAGEEVVIEVDYAGNLIERLHGKSSTLRTTSGWYPEVNGDDLSTFDATFHWPRAFELVAAGTVTGGSAEGAQEPWRRYSIDRPTLGYTFEIGRFRTFSARAGAEDHVAVTFYFDRGSWDLVRDNREQIVSAVVDSLTYFEEIFGPYPLDTLSVVTTQRGFSQAMVGFVTLSSLMVTGNSLATWLFGLEDPRTVIAHEVSHQWWGHRVGWRTYRDQWVSEAMANYSASLFARHRLTESVVWRGPTAGWKNSLQATLDDGRSIESVGPLVLGNRLISSRSDDAYQAIVYKKGALILEMLSRLFGEETFVKIQKALIKAVDGKQISTAEFLSLIERITDQDLQWFAEQFIYNTGLTEVFYEWQAHPLESGEWEVRGVAHQVANYRFDYSLVRREGGGVDADRTARRDLDVAGSRLIVPVEIDVYDPQKKDETTKKKKRRKTKNGSAPAANKRLGATTWIGGEKTPFFWKLPLEPRKVQFDRLAQVFGIFTNQRRHPKRTLYVRGMDRLADGDATAALDLLDQASASEVFVAADSSDETDEKALEGRARRLDIGIGLGRARCLLALERDAQAAQALQAADDLLRSDDSRWYPRQLAILRARVALRANDPNTAYGLLRKALRKGKIRDTEGQLLYAAAAKLIGRDKEFAEAKEKALARGADVSLLEDL